MRSTVVVNCDICGQTLAGDNSDGWSGKLPMPSVPPTAEDLKANPKLKRGQYSITHTDLCFPCVSKLGDFIQQSKK